MYTPEQQEVLEQFKEFAKKVGNTSKACRQIGISDTIMSQLKKGNYPGDVSAQIAKIKAYFDVKVAAAALPSTASATYSYYVPTSFSRSVYDTIKICQLQGGLSIACGDAGVGKTKAAKKFCTDHQTDAIYIVLNPCLKTIKSVLKILCQRLNVNERTIDEMWIGLTNKLRDGMVIIIDEAQHLPVKTIESLRALSDHFAERGSTLGICFIGNVEAINYFGGKEKAEFAQIANRTKQRRMLTTNQTKVEDVKMLFPALKDEMAIELLLTISRSQQAIRGAMNLFNNALDNEDTSYEGLVAMAKHMDMVLV